MVIFKWFCIIFIFILFPSLTVKAAIPADDYHTYVEIIMDTGKLMKNFTDEELKECYSKIDGVNFFNIKVLPVNENIHASYISNTLFSVDNSSNSEVTYDVDVSVETNNKISFSYDGSLSAAGKATIDKVKAEASSKTNIGFDASSETSVKEKKKTKIIVEPGSRAIIYLEGEMSITNGVIVVYRLFMKAYSGGYEFITLKSQYARIEKSRI